MNTTVLRVTNEVENSHNYPAAQEAIKIRTKKRKKKKRREKLFKK